MEPSRKLFAGVLVVLLLFVATEMMPVQARVCESQSFEFKGPCIISANCANVCKTEGFTGGKCRGVLRLCYCTKPCPAGTRLQSGDGSHE